jgi:hypothetical protein
MKKTIKGVTYDTEMANKVVGRVVTEVRHVTLWRRYSGEFFVSSVPQSQNTNVSWLYPLTWNEAKEWCQLLGGSVKGFEAEERIMLKK